MVPHPDQVGFGWSAGGLVFPYFVGSLGALRERGCATSATKMAGSSAGSLLAAFHGCDLETEAIITATRRMYYDLRTGGTTGRLGQVLHRFLEETLPVDAHERCTEKTHVGVTRIFPRPVWEHELVSSWSSRDDLVASLLTSCHVPFFLEKYSVGRSFRDGFYTDGGFTSFIPVPRGIKESQVYQVTCFPIGRQVKRLKEDRSSSPSPSPSGGGGGRVVNAFERLKLSPDLFRGEEETYPMSVFLRKAFVPGTDEEIDELLQMGRDDALQLIKTDPVLSRLATK